MVGWIKKELLVGTEYVVTQPFHAFRIIRNGYKGYLLIHFINRFYILFRHWLQALHAVGIKRWEVDVYGINILVSTVDMVLFRSHKVGVAHIVYKAYDTVHRSRGGIRYRDTYGQHGERLFERIEHI